MKQRDVFLQSEGDAWFQRNCDPERAALHPESDPLLPEVLAITSTQSGRSDNGMRVLEIGCGDGARLAWLKDHHGYQCHGIDPSRKAVEAARKRGVAATQGTADRLPYDDQSVDILIFGFCLYLCDRDDLFRIAAEADRVLETPGWMLIMDFYAPEPSRREYHHVSGLFSYKMDYAALFTWHPAYTLYSHRLHDHSQGGYTDDPDEWVAVSVLRKRLAYGG